MTPALSVATEDTSAKPNIIVIFTDDHGYADLSCQGYEKDVKTPNLDRFAAEGARFTNGYVTAPQCCPSRAGLLSGRDQNRFGFHSNGHGPLPLDQPIMSEHFAKAGYTTGMVGKWHMEPNQSDKAFLEKHKIKDGRIPPKLEARYHPHSRGFQETFFGYLNRYSVTYDLQGKRFPEPKPLQTTGDRLDRQSEAALRFIDLHHTEPFFLYLAYYAPHVPLASSKKYLDRFPGEMPERRRYALAMISAVDEGVGQIMKKLDQYGIDGNTLIYFIGDNGAPLKLTMPDDPVQLDGAYWDGSKNTPLTGEKGMLAEGGIRVPYLMRWKSVIPPGQVIHTPVTTLDVARTSMTAAKISPPHNLDGSNLLPLLIDKTPLPERTLHWRFWNQTAARKGDWKLLKLGNQKPMLFDLAKDIGEKHDLAGENPDLVRELEASLTRWTTDLIPAGMPTGTGNGQEQKFYQHHFPTLQR